MTGFEEIAHRLDHLQQQVGKSGVGLLAIAPTSTMRYLLRFAPLADERPCLLLVTAHDVRLVAPDLTAPQIEAHSGLETIRWKDVAGARPALLEAMSALSPRPGAVLAADAAMSADVFLLL